MESIQSFSCSQFGLHDGRPSTVPRNHRLGGLRYQRCHRPTDAGWVLRSQQPADGFRSSSGRTCGSCQPSHGSTAQLRRVGEKEQLNSAWAVKSQRTNWVSMSIYLYLSVKGLLMYSDDSLHFVYKKLRETKSTQAEMNKNFPHDPVWRLYLETSRWPVTISISFHKTGLYSRWGYHILAVVTLFVRRIGRLKVPQLEQSFLYVRVYVS